MLQIVRPVRAENVTATASGAASSAAAVGENCVRVIPYGGSARVHIGRSNSVSAASCLLADSAAEYFMVTAGDRVYAKREGDTDVPVNVTFCTR